MTGAAPSAIGGGADNEAIAARVAELLDRPPRSLPKADGVAGLLAVDIALVYGRAMRARERNRP